MKQQELGRKLNITLVFTERVSLLFVACIFLRKRMGLYKYTAWVYEGLVHVSHDKEIDAVDGCLKSSSLPLMLSIGFQHDGISNLI